MKRKLTETSASIIIKAIGDARVMIANWPATRPEFRGEMKRIRRELKNAAKIVASCVEPQSDLFDAQS